MRNTLHILLVEDEVITGMLMKSELKKAGYGIISNATTGEKAFILAVEKRPDFILMDINMPGKIDGIEAASRIKSVYDVPLIFVTGYDDQQIKTRAQGVNPIAYLIKPVEISKIMFIIDSHFDNKNRE